MPSPWSTARRRALRSEDQMRVATIELVEAIAVSEVLHEDRIAQTIQLAFVHHDGGQVLTLGHVGSLWICARCARS